MVLRAGDVIEGRYELLQRLGRGGMGAVYRAHDARLGRDVAVKVLDGVFAEDEEFLERFLREARAAASLNHPGIVGVYDRGEFDGFHYIVMELVDGPSLGDLLRAEGPQQADRVLAIGVAVAEALGAAHRVGVVHRDVKPSNVLLTPRGAVKVTDFGIARSASDATLTATDSVLGSIPYVAPEQVRGELATPASDVYALGCTLYALLTGEPPFRAEAVVSVLHQHLSTDPEPPSSVVPDVPSTVDDVVLRLLAKDPGDRPADGDRAAQLLRVPGQPIAHTLPLVPADVLERTRRLRGDELAALAAGDGTQLLREETAVAAERTRVLATADEGDDDHDDGHEDDELPLRWGRRIAVMALIAALVIAAAVLGDQLSAEESPDQVPSAPATTPSPEVTTAPSPTPEPSPSPSPPSITDVIDEIGEMLSGGRGSSMSNESVDKLAERLFKVVQEYGERDWDEARKKTDELREELRKRAEKGEVTEAAAAQMNEAIDRLVQLLRDRS